MPDLGQELGTVLALWLLAQVGWTRRCPLRRKLISPQNSRSLSLVVMRFGTSAVGLDCPSAYSWPVIAVWGNTHRHTPAIGIKLQVPSHYGGQLRLKASELRIGAVKAITTYLMLCHGVLET